MRFLGTKPKLINTEIKGNDTNIIYCESNVTIMNSNIIANGSNALIYLSTGVVQAHIFSNSNSRLYIGKNNYFPTCYGTFLTSVFICVADGTTITIGSECPISSGVCIESGDGHNIFDLTTGKNVSKNEDIFIGDAVWLGRDSHILKGSIVNTGSIIGSAAVLTGKHTNTGEVWAGVPARCIRSGVVYGHVNQSYLGQDKRYNFWNSIDAFKYNKDEEITIERLKTFTLEDFKKLQLSNGRFIWKM